MRGTDQPNRPSISIAYLQLLLEIMVERGYTEQDMLCGIPLDRTLLDQPRARMSPQQWSLLILRAMELCGEAGLGYEYGLRMRPSVHGVIGYATMSATTLRQSLEISSRYFRVRQEGFSLSCQEQDKHMLLRIEERYRIPMLRSFFYENLLIGLARGLAVLLGRELEELQELEIQVDWPEPPYHPLWQQRLPAFSFSQPANLLRIPRTWLDLRPVLADPLASRQAIGMCERELALAAAQEPDLTVRVRAELNEQVATGYPRLEEVAMRLCMSPRSLKRKLQCEGTSFALLLEQEKHQEARQLLTHTDLPIQDIATRLGYSNPANFTRAFRKWAGMTPIHYRQQARGRA